MYLENIFRRCKAKYKNVLTGFHLKMTKVLFC